jgi:hypothetical protein
MAAALAKYSQYPRFLSNTNSATGCLDAEGADVEANTGTRARDDGESARAAWPARGLPAARLAGQGAEDADPYLRAPRASPDP